MNTVTIKPYSDPEHRGQVVALWDSVFAYTTPHNEPSLAIDKKIAFNDGLFFVATDGDLVVGTVMAGYDGHRGWIYSVAVSKGHRNQGIGTQLVGCAEKILTALGCVKINLQIMSGNETVANFYASLGFTLEKTLTMGKRIEKNLPPK